MSALRFGLIAKAGGCLALAGLCSCAVEGVGVGGSVDVGYGGGYYEPYGYDYGGWGPGYYVGPGRGDGRRFYGNGDFRGGGDHGGYHGGGRPAYRPAPQDRPMPSMPHGSRSSGGGGRR